MADYDFLSVSNGSGDAALMHVNGSGRLVGATSIPVDTVANVATKGIATSGTLGSDGKITAATKRDFKYHISGSTLVIDGWLPGSTDLAHTAGMVVVIKPNTHWTNTVATFIKNVTGNGSVVEGLFLNALSVVGTISAQILTLTGNLTVGGNSTITGNHVVNGTSRTAAAAITSAATITPTVQIYSITALATAATINVPSFAANDGMSAILRIKDNGTARALTWAGGYSNVSGLDTPATTIAGKQLTVGTMYNSATSKWEIQGINQSA